MTKLFIGNATKQIIMFCYRLPENPGVRIQHIAMGEQIQISGNLSTPEVDAIIDQNRKYGLIEVDKIDRTKDFAGICYSIDKPISVNALMRAIAHNTEALNERGRENRKEAALESNRVLEASLADSGRPEGLRNLDVSVQEEKVELIHDRAPIAEGVRVTRDPDTSEGGRKGGRGGRGGRR